MPAALAFLILITLTNYTMIFFSCHGLHTYGAWLNKYHKVDLWLHRVLVSKEAQLQVYVSYLLFQIHSNNNFCLVRYISLHLLSLLQVQNGIAIYATWTTIASLVNLTIVLIYDANMSQLDAPIVSLSILTAVLIVW